MRCAVNSPSCESVLSVSWILSDRVLPFPHAVFHYGDPRSTTEQLETYVLVLLLFQDTPDAGLSAAEWVAKR